MPSVKPSYKLSELEAAWKSFKPVLARNTGLSKLLNTCGDFQLKVLKTQDEAKRWAKLFSDTTQKMNEVRKLPAVKKDKNALLFLDRAGDALSKGDDTKILWQIVAGNRTYDPVKKAWDLSTSQKKQTGRA